MLVLKNGGRVTAEGGSPLANSEINALKLEDVSIYSFGLTSIGPIRIHWGDGTSTSLAAKPDGFTVTKRYATAGSYSIVVENADSITELRMTSAHSGYSRVRSNVAWFSQFVRCRRIALTDVPFTGELGSVIDKLPNLRELAVSYNVPTPLTLNLSSCKSFWSRCEYISIIRSGSFILGNLSDVILSPSCRYIYLHNLPKGRYSGIVKNGYTALTDLYIFSYETDADASLPSFDGWQIPESLLSVAELRYSTYNVGTLRSFDFRNLTAFSLAAQVTVDLSSNDSFRAFASRASGFSIWDTWKDVKVPIAALNNPSGYTKVRLHSLGNNLSFGDISYLLQRTSVMLWVSGGSYNEGITGAIPEATSFTAGAGIVLKNIAITGSSQALLNLIAKAGDFVLEDCPNIHASISGASFARATWNYYGVSISNNPNLQADVTTFSFGSTFFGPKSYLMKFSFCSCAGFTGDLGSFPIWTVSLSTLNLSACSYTGIPAFIRRVFANRNTCLRNNGAIMTLSVQGNVDNSLLTGTYQQPPLGSYTGNINNLTEEQVDNLANGLDHTGTSTSPAWTDREKIWFLVRCKNSATDTSSRYRVTINY